MLKCLKKEVLVWNYNYEFDFKGMTSITDFVKTVWDFLNDIKEKYQDKKILLVTHNGVCRAIGAYFNGIPEDGNLSIYAHDNCQIKKVYNRIIHID